MLGDLCAALVVPFDVGVPLRLVGLDVHQCDAAGFGPGPKNLTDVFRVVVDTKGKRLPAPCDDPVE